MNCVSLEMRRIFYHSLSQVEQMIVCEVVIILCSGVSFFITIILKIFLLVLILVIEGQRTKAIRNCKSYRGAENYSINMTMEGNGGLIKFAKSFRQEELSKT